jgi:hypothetical protein
MRKSRFRYLRGGDQNSEIRLIIREGNLIQWIFRGVFIVYIILSFYVNSIPIGNVKTF